MDTAERLLWVESWHPLGAAINPSCGLPSEVLAWFFITDGSEN